MANNLPNSPAGPPSYSASVSSPYKSPLTLSSASLPQNLATARTCVITAVLTTHILPHLHATALSGLSSSTLLLIPSNISSLQPPLSTSKKDASGQGNALPGETVIGFPSAENLNLIRLHNQENSLEFWRQPAVINELEQQLCSQLRREGHHIVGDGDGEGNPKASSSRPKRFFKKRSPSVEWKTPEIEPLGDGEVRAAVELKDISLRIENDMGLYETRTGKAVVIKVDVGGWKKSEK